MNRLLLLLTVFLTICLGVGCTPKQSYYSVFRDIPEDGWHREDKLVFAVEDSAGLKGNLELTVCHDAYYSYRNLWLFIDYVMADSAVVRDTVECVLSDVSGNWNGKGFGAHFQYEQLLKPKFELRNCREIVIEHGMRHPVVENVSSVGVSLQP